jgi:hypothetical protein
VDRVVARRVRALVTVLWPVRVAQAIGPSPGRSSPTQGRARQQYRLTFP